MISFVHLSNASVSPEKLCKSSISKSRSLDAIVCAISVLFMFSPSFFLPYPYITAFLCWLLCTVCFYVSISELIIIYVVVHINRQIIQIYSRTFV